MDESDIDFINPFTVISIGVGDGVDQVEMKMIASDTNKYYYIDQGYGALDELTE